MSRIPLYSRLLAAAALALIALPRPAAADLLTNMLYTFTFTACDFVVGCPAPTTFAKFQFAGPALAAPALGPGTGAFESARQPVAVEALAGSWAGLYIYSYRVGGYVGSSLLFDDFTAANGNDYGYTVGIDGYVGGPTVPPLVWGEGEYTGLIAYECNYGIACPSTAGANERIRLSIVAETINASGDTGTVGGGTPVPEQATGALLLGGLASLAVARRAGTRTARP